jgi:integrase/recombinase XerC
MTDIAHENSLTTFDQDILTELLRDKRSPNTRRTYSNGLKDFFLTMTQFEPPPDAVAWFLSLGRFQAIACNQDCIVDRIEIPSLISRQ